jgi:acyl-CoA synthetase (AMP-forming)/AMP-acid ligase II/acyl carrier protein
VTVEGALYPLLQRWAQLDQAALAIGNRQGAWLSRGDLDALLVGGRGRLRQLGLQPCDRVAMLMPQSLEGAIVALQVASACSLAPLRPGLPPQEWSILLAHLAPAALVIDAGSAEEVVAAARRLAIPLIDPEDLLSPKELPDARTSFPVAEDLSEASQAVVLATSGSTGRPKWVHLSQAALLRGCQAMARSLDLTPADRALLALPLHHAHGLVSGLLMPLISGGSVVVAERFDAAELLQAIQELAISWISLPPAMHRALLDQQRRTPLEPGHRLRFLRSGAISLPPHLIASLQAAFGVPLVEAYGMSECPHISGNPIDAPHPGSVGIPAVEHLAILGPEGNECPINEWGEVAVRGAPLMGGYVLNGHIQPLPPVNSWFRTGDLGRLDERGYLWLKGRIKETINRGGLKVMPVVVDAALLSHPDVQEVAAFAVPHPTLGEDIAAAVVLRAGAALDEQELRQHAFSALAPHEVPSRILFLEELPRGATGKLQRIGLAECLGDALRPAKEPAVGEMEELVASAIADVLELSPPSRDANFFLLGGDSLSGTRVITRLAEQLSLDLQPTLLFTAPTVRTLAEKLDQLLDETLAQLEAST